MYGGLGNQLFQYFAAKYVQNTSGCELSFDFTHIESKKAHADSDIRDFAFFNNEVAISRSPVNPMGEFVLRGRNYLARKSDFSSRMFKLDAPGNNEPNISNHIKDNWRLEGYYQDFKYYFEHLKRNPNFNWELIHLKHEFSATLENYRPRKVLSLHLRGGDYLKTPTLYKQLDANYYDRAIRHLRSIFSEEQIIVYTDDVEHARRILRGIDDLKYEIAPELSPSETLLLLSNSKGIITSNSTFSAWAAVISSDESHIVGPAEWFSNRRLSQPTLSRAKLLQ